MRDERCVAGADCALYQRSLSQHCERYDTGLKVFHPNPLKWRYLTLATNGRPQTVYDCSVSL